MRGLDGIPNHLPQPRAGWKRAGIDTLIPKFDQETAEVLSNDSIAEGIYVMRLVAPLVAARAQPAQFVNIKTDPGLSPFLRRPLSILNADPCQGWIEIYYDVIGAGTERLGSLAVGTSVDLIGPLGLPFEPRSGHTLLIGGGVGIVPLAYLAWHSPKDRETMTLLMGAATSSRIPDLSRIVPADLTTVLATDDGSIGHHGFVTELIEQHLHEETEILTCGPHAMMARIAEIACEASVPCYASLENHMACGFGACVGCVVEYKRSDREDRRYRRVCLEGPVVNASEIVW
ncbi:MAG TPA: dihydroorotate dehydrogenase electron transfer subunit [Candidatus Latescibacteria bacterium]|jgi:dihydroorotate dehydrogenase electron transfer subunit|nr:dihydroorotate dehydrogenase electron transfer subunit [Candidatus Latescibacterota bacterium]